MRSWELVQIRFRSGAFIRRTTDAGLTRSTFYNHFESRDALALEAVRLRNKWEMETFSKAVQDKGGYHPRVMLLEGAITYRQVTDDNNAARIARRTAAARLDQYLAETTA